MRQERILTCPIKVKQQFASRVNITTKVSEWRIPTAKWSTRQEFLWPWLANLSGCECARVTCETGGCTCNGNVSVQIALPCHLYTGWHIRLYKTSCWLQNRSANLACPGLARPKQNFYFEVNGSFTQPDMSPCITTEWCIAWVVRFCNGILAIL